MFIIQCKSKQVPGKLTPIISGYHGKGKLVLDQRKAIKYRTLLGAKKASLQIPPDFDPTIIEI